MKTNCKLVFVFLLTLISSIALGQTASFSITDTVCVNTPVIITNSSTNATTYNWNYCTANINSTPTGSNLGNPGNQLTTPCFIDYAFENGNYYGFIVSNNPPSLVRLDFGNSLLNTPTAVNLGDFGGILPLGAQGIQLIQEGGKWFAIITGGDVMAAPTATSRIIKVDFGANLTNTSPTVTNWGNIGSLSYPVDLFMFKDAGIWHGFTVNYHGNTITRFNFGANFNSPPTGVNLGNLGSINQPNGICTINDNGTWRLFVANYGSNSLSRIDFGNSLLNPPTSSVNLGSLGGKLHKPRDLYIFNYCNNLVGFLINEQTDDLVRLNFNSLNTIPNATSLGNVAAFGTPHSISKLFREGADLYAFVPNSYENTVSRIKFSGCFNSSLPNSNVQNPPPLTYNQPGTYNVTLVVNEGLLSQTSMCKQVVVLPYPAHSPTQNILICQGQNKKIGSPITSASYLWSTGETTDSVVINAPGIYWVESNRYGCSVRDSFNIDFFPAANVDFSYKQNICNPKTIQFSSDLSTSQVFQWNFGNGLTNGLNPSPQMVYSNLGSYDVILKVQNANGCFDNITKIISVNNIQDNGLVFNSDTTICKGDSILLNSSGSLLDYCWKASNGNIPSTLNGYAYPVVTTTYSLTSLVTGTNLVANGDFSSGNSGFVSDYVYTMVNNSEGQYGIGTSPSIWYNNIGTCGDHTSGSGNMMLVNGSSSAGVRLWTQTLAVNPNTDYLFSAWLQSLKDVNPANLQLSINNVNLGLDMIAGSGICQWNQYSTTWNSGNSTSVVLTLINNENAVAGNDFAIDDIFFGTVSTRKDSVLVNVSGFCDSIQLDGSDKVCSSEDTVNYSIYRSPGCTEAFFIQVDNAYADIIEQTSDNIKLVYKQNGTTKLNVSFINSCEVVADSIEVTIKFSPAGVNLGPDLITCRDTILNLDAGTGFENYIWQNGSTNSTFLADSPGIYQVQAQNLCGDVYEDDFEYIKSLPSPFLVTPLSAEVCEGDSVQFNTSGGSVYSWQPAINFANPSGASTKALINVSQDFSLFISDPVCQRDTTIIIPVIASTSAAITLNKSNDVSCSVDSSVLKANGGISYTWSPDLFITRNILGQITVKPTQDITYYVTGVNALGCEGIDSVTVSFKKEGEQKLFVPTAFTPNGDGLNDIFKPIFIGPALKYDLRIFNRWGQLVFRTSNPNQGWNGRFNSESQPGNVFVYYITAEGGCEGKFERKGTFVLIQ